MERLTTRLEDGNFIPTALCTIGRDGEVDDIDGCTEYCDHCKGECLECVIQKCFNKLAEYEDLEEQGLLLRLPIEAYFIKDKEVYKGWVQELVYSPCRKLLLDIRYDNNTLDSYRGYVGNTVFLTQEEAEQKLK